MIVPVLPFCTPRLTSTPSLQGSDKWTVHERELQLKMSLPSPIQDALETVMTGKGNLLR